MSATHDAAAATSTDGPVKIFDFSVHGEGIGRLPDGLVVFVDGGIVGDEVEVKLRPRRGKLAFADVVRIVTPSPDRVVSRCDIAACGGCPIKGSALQMQAEIKARRAVQTLRRVGGVVPGHVAPVLAGAGDGWGYRHRVRLHASWLRGQSEHGGGWQLGYHQKQSHALVPLSTCPVLWPELERLGRAVAAGLAGLGQHARLESVELAYSRRDGRGGAKVVAHGPVAAFRQSLQWIETSELSGIEVVAGDGSFRWGNLELRYDHAQADAFDLRFEAGLFTQANVAQNDALVAEVLRQVAPGPNLQVLELHAGIGNFSVALARQGAHVAAFERGRRAAVLLQKNARQSGVEIDVHAADDVDALPLLQHRFDVLLLDPPRGGIPTLAPQLAKLAARGTKLADKIVYVSCDPATLARDAAHLVAAGHRLSYLRPIDMFAQTSHLETVAVFTAGR